MRHRNFTFQGDFSSFWQPDPVWHAFLPEQFAALYIEASGISLRVRAVLIASNYVEESP